MDKALFLGTHGAKNSMRQLEILTNNLANVNTTGFRADHEAMRQLNANNKGQQTRTYSVVDKTYTDFKQGPIIHTDRSLDVAINGEGFISVQTKSGQEAYTRAGDLQLTTDGLLVTKTGDVVLGTSGVINTGRAQKVSISSDGTVSVLLPGQQDPVSINRIKLTKPQTNQLQKGTDGLFYATGDTPALQDNKIRLVIGSLEGSNVNPVESLTNLIELSREFELHTNLMKTMQSDASKANQILAMPR